MTSYYTILKKALEKGRVERDTCTQSGNTILKQEGKIIYGKEEDEEYIKDYLSLGINLVIFGSGHISKALCEISQIVGIRTTVIDDREEYLTNERFPHSTLIKYPLDKLEKSTFSFSSPYFVIVTHGHKMDEECLKYSLSVPSLYVGMIGSKRKVQETLSRLEAIGYSKEILNTIHSPIGLDIKAETPEEIAISIIGEIIKCYRSEKDLITIKEEYLESIENKKGVSCRIISKSGSAPRGKGSEMFISENGETFGTIGGGMLEKVVINEAIKFLSEEGEHKLLEYNLSSGGNISMICGGEERILLTKIN